MGEESTKEVKDIVEEEKQEIILIDEEMLRSKIYEIRGQKVMLDFELAEIYGYTTTKFNQQVRNNIEKFDDDFMFPLTKDEFQNLMSKNLTSSWGGRRKLPNAFTEQGVYMLMTVLKGELATKQSKALIRTFKKMKDYIIGNQNLIGQREYLLLSLQMSENLLATWEMRSDLTDVQQRMANVLDQLGDFVTHSELHELMPGFEDDEDKDKDKRGYLLLNGKPFWGDLVYEEIYGRARRTIYIVDNYIGIKTLEKLINIPKGVKVSVFSDNLAKLSANTYLDFCKEYPNIAIELYKSGGIFHDRYIVLDYDTADEKIFLCGGSSKDVGGKVTTILEDQDRNKYQGMIQKLLKNPKLVLK